MFGGPLPQPVERKVQPRQHPTQDILNTSVTPGLYGHRAREPNTNFHVKLLHYNQRTRALCDEGISKETKQIENDKYMIRFGHHVEKKQLQAEIKNRMNQKLIQYEVEVNDRRERLKELFATEERQFAKETIDNAQKGVYDKLSEMKLKIQKLKAKKETERQELIHEKRLDQYMQRCMELRPAMNKKHLIESKHIQLQQMRENEARREAERELDKMWAQLQEKETLARAEREKQEVIWRYNKKKLDMEVLDMQIEGKRLLKEEAKKVEMEDRIEMVKLGERMEQEEREAKEKERLKRDRTTSELLNQIQITKGFLAQRKKEEAALEQAFSQLAQLELEREHNKIQDNTTELRKEKAQYRQHLAELEESRREEERRLDEMLQKYQCEVNKKYDEAQCELYKAREKLQKDVVIGREAQLAFKRNAAEQMLQMQEAENELMRIATDTNERLLLETNRLALLAAQQYREDLSKQIEYNSILRDRENAELERQLQNGKEEELKYRTLVETLIKQGHSAGSKKHPFRSLIEQHDCHCKLLPPKY